MTDKVLQWLASRDTGLSSRALAFEFLGVEYDGSYFTPCDPYDLGRCLRLIKIEPPVRSCVDSLALRHERWAKAAKVWDIIAKSMEDEVGIDLSKGKSAPKTYDLMKKAGL